jgi:cytidylate kinase
MLTQREFLLDTVKKYCKLYAIDVTDLSPNETACILIDCLQIKDVTSEEVVYISDNIDKIR